MSRLCQHTCVSVVPSSRRAARRPTLLWPRMLAIDRRLAHAYDPPPKGAAVRSLPFFMPQREMEAIQRSLDEALSLLADPYRLYTEAPEGINLMLIQAVCEKIWILDTGVVGVELTAPYLELLTVEARLAFEADETAADEPEDREGVRVYYRRARALRRLAGSNQRTWSRLPIERPHGLLPVERQNPTSTGRQGPDVLHLVAPTGFEPALPP